MARAGVPFEFIARQLRHRDVAMVAKVYGRFKPDTEERDRWERIAAARDAERFERRGATGGAKADDAHVEEKNESPASPWETEASSRAGGENRTHDPLITSEVLYP